MCAVANHLIVTLIHLQFRVQQKFDFVFIIFFYQSETWITLMVCNLEPGALFLWDAYIFTTPTSCISSRFRYFTPLSLSGNYVAIHSAGMLQNL